MLLNRSGAYYKMELLKLALKDADAALAIDPASQKAYMRKGTPLPSLFGNAWDVSTYHRLSLTPRCWDPSPS